MLQPVPAEPLSIAQVAPLPAGRREPGQRVRRPASRRSWSGAATRSLRRRHRRPGQAAAAAATQLGHRPRPRALRAERLLGGAAPLLLAQRRHLPRAAGAGPLDPGGAAAGRDLLRPPRRPHGDHARRPASCSSATSPATYELVEPGGRGTRLGRGRRRARSDLPAPAGAPPRPRAATPRCGARIAGGR